MSINQGQRRCLIAIRILKKVRFMCNAQRDFSNATRNLKVGSKMSSKPRNTFLINALGSRSSAAAVPAEGTSSSVLREQNPVESGNSSFLCDIKMRNKRSPFSFHFGHENCHQLSSKRKNNEKVNFSLPSRVKFITSSIWTFSHA